MWVFKMITAKQLSNILYTHDLVGTCCNVNKGMLDEYDYEAKEIILQLSLGIPFKTALYHVFSLYFWDEALDGAEFFVAIVEAEYYNHLSRYDI